MQCPACATPLVTDCIDTVVLFGCPTCLGTLVPQRDLARVIDVLVRQTPNLTDRPVEEIRHSTQPRICPRCDQAMDSFGYMGTKFVLLDRCESDGLVWTDVEELHMMARMVAHNQRRHLGQHKGNMKRLERMRPQPRSTDIDGAVWDPADYGLSETQLLTTTESTVVGVILSALASSGD